MKKGGKKNEADSKGIVAEIDKRFERHTNILMEQMRHEVKTVAEGHSIIIKKLEDHDNEFSKIKSDIGELKTDVHVLKSDVREIKSELHSMNAAIMETGRETKGHEKRITKLEEKVLV